MDVLSASLAFVLALSSWVSASGPFYQYIPLEYTKYPSETNGNDTTWTLELQFKATALKGMLAYFRNSQSFGALILDDVLKVHLKFNKQPDMLNMTISELKIDHWHHLSFTCTGSLLRVQMDGTQLTKRLDDAKFVSFDDLFIGGFDMADAHLPSELVVDRLFRTPFSGCVANVTVNRHRMAFADTAVPFKHYQWCAAESDDARLFNDGLRLESAIQPVYVTDPIVVREGGSTRLEWLHLYVFPQHKRYNIENHNIVFRVLGQPRHGKVTLGNELIRRSFTYDDILRGRVNYTHDGSETREDSLEIEVEIRNVSKSAPATLHRSYSYSLPIRIAPVNDPPELRLPNGAIIRLPQNSRIPVSQDVLLVADPDDPPREVSIQVVYTTPGGATFERRDIPGKPLEKFTQEELVAGHIRLAHKGHLHSQIDVVAADGETRSVSQTLRVEAFPIQVRLVDNTGLSVLHRSSATITAGNLTFASNLDGVSGGDSLDVHYTIVEIAQHGFVEIEDSNGHFYISSGFNQSDVNAGRVRYRHAKDDRPVSDSFRFQVSVGNISSTIVYDFKILFVPVNIKVFNPTPFLVNNTQQLTLTRDHLFAWTFPKSASPDQLVYHVTQAPKYGFVYRRINRDSGRNRRIGLYSNFTQAHIDAGDIFYQLHFVHYSIVNDHFGFKVVAPFVSSEALRFDITFIPGVEGIQLINRTFVVAEGALQAITNNTLFLETPDDSDFLFTVGVAPTNGALHVSKASGARVELRMGDNFTTQDLLAGRLWYFHDDSETTTDRAYLIARPLHQRSEDARIPFWFNIRIILQNDHKPERKVESTFHLVTRGERLVGRKDLEFVDRDSDFDSRQLRYFFPDEYENGGFFWTRLPDVPVYNFTQNDINERRLLFRHLGAKFQFSLPFTVSDNGKTEKSYFVVNATAAFLRVKMNTGIVLNKGEMAVIGPNNITIETNLNIEPSAITIEVPENITGGKFMVVQPGTDQGQRRRIFTQHDIDEYRVLYADDGAVDGAIEKLKVRVYAADLHIWMDLNIVVRTRHRKNLLSLDTNAPLTVTVGGLAQIGPDTLRASQVQLMAGTVQFLVISHPQRGSLILETPTKIPYEQWKSAGGMRSLIAPSNFFVQRFSQFDLETGALQYLHSGTPTDTSDSFVFNVTTGEEMIGPFTFQIRIVRNQVLLHVISNLTVEAGGSVPLTPLVLRSESTYYENPELLFKLIKEPTVGWLEAPNRTAVRVFTNEDLIAGRISYCHNARDFAWTDNFTLVASMREKPDVSSDQKMIFVRVLRKNNRAPELVRNSALQMWSSRVSPISEDLLQAVDPDTEPKDVHFLITSPSNGYLAFMAQPTISVFNFSQQDIDNRRLAFIRYANGTSGGFSFIVSDGIHQIGPEWFTVEAADVNLALEANARLVVAPDSDAVVGMDLLRANVASAEAWQILFSIVKPPKLGILLLRGRPTDRFTQLDINQRLVSYRQNGERPKSWIKRDAFHFVIALNGTKNAAVSATLEEERRFRILISYAALAPDKLDSFIKRVPVRLPETGSLAVNSSHINMSNLIGATEDSLVLRIVRPPRHGLIEYGGRNWTEDIDALRFTATDLDSNALVYRHVGTFTGLTVPQEDDVTVEVFPASESYTRRRVLRLRFQLPIQIMPASDDQLTIKALPHNIHMVRGAIVKLEPSKFQIVHDSKPPSNLFYNLIQGPTVGKITSEDRPGEAISSFTQADVNKGRVRFEQSGTDTKGVMTFRITSDNGHQGFTRVVNINVEPLSLSLVNLTTIRYRQGKTYIVLNETHLGADSNGPRDKIVYNITRPPRNGTFYWVAGEKEANSFTQTDIDEGRVLYAQLNMESYKDSFEFRVANQQNEINNKQLDVRVVPAVRQRPVSVVPGGSVVINSDVLDASELEGNAPRFLIITPPKYGRLILNSKDTARKSRAQEERSFVNDSSASDANALGQLNDEASSSTQDVLFFTYKDVKNGWIRYTNTLEEAHGSLEDGFEYELRATQLQPARDIFVIEVRVPMSGGTINRDVVTGSPPPDQTPQSKMPWLPRMTTGYAVPALALTALVVLACAIVFIRRTRIGRKRESRYIKEKHEMLLATPQPDLPPPQPDLLGTTVYATVGPTRSASLRHHSPMPAAVNNSDYGTVMHTSSGSPSLMRPNLITFDPGRTELISSVPMCKVTPLTAKYGTAAAIGASASGSSSGCEEYWRGAYHYSSSASDTDLKTERLSLDHATGQRRKPARASSKPPTKLKENQYWV